MILFCDDECSKACAEKTPYTARANMGGLENKLTNRVAGAKTISIVYDGDGNRVTKRLEFGTNIVTIGYLVDTVNPSGFAQVLEELTGGQVTRAYTYGHDLISQDQLDSSGTNWVASFYGYDGHGSVRFLTDDLGVVTDTYDYDAFGTLIDSTGTTPNNYLYTGEQRDPDLGLYCLRARYMDTDRGRFWNMDTFEGINNEPLSLNKYLYANANSPNLIDPAGNFPSIAALAVTASIIGTLSKTATQNTRRQLGVRWKGTCQLGIAVLWGKGFVNMTCHLVSQPWSDGSLVGCFRTIADATGTAVIKSPKKISKKLKTQLFGQVNFHVEFNTLDGKASNFDGDFELKLAGAGFAIAGSKGEVTMGKAKGKWSSGSLGGGIAFGKGSLFGTSSVTEAKGSPVPLKIKFCNGAKDPVTGF